MDADDWSFPYRLERQMEFLESHPDICVLGTDAIFMDDNKDFLKYKVHSHTEIASTLPFYCCITHPTVIFLREAILQIGGYPETIAAQDYALWAKIAFTTDYKMAVLPEVCLKYRRSSTQKKYGLKQKNVAIETKNFIAVSLGIHNPRLWTSHLNKEDYFLALAQLQMLKNKIIEKFGSSHILNINIAILRLNLLHQAQTNHSIKGIKYSLQKKLLKLRLSIYKRLFL